MRATTLAFFLLTSVPEEGEAKSWSTCPFRKEQLLWPRRQYVYTMSDCVYLWTCCGSGKFCTVTACLRSSPLCLVLYFPDCICGLLWNHLSFHRCLEAHLSFADVLFCSLCTWIFSTLCTTSTPSGFWHIWKAKPRTPTTKLHLRASCREWIITQDRYGQHRVQLPVYSQAFTNLLPSIHYQFWSKNIIFERLVWLAVGCWHFCTQNKPHDFSEKLLNWKLSC